MVRPKYVFFSLETVFEEIFKRIYLYIYLYILGGARGVMVIVVGYGHDDTSSNPGPWERYESNYSPSSYG